LFDIMHAQAGGGDAKPGAATANGAANGDAGGPADGSDSGSNRGAGAPPPRLCQRGVCGADGAALRAAATRAPTRWSATDARDSMTISDDGLMATYAGAGLADADASAVRADVPVPTGGAAFFYYEMYVQSAGASGFIGIGLSARDVKLTRLPGWEARSWAYHADDGHAFAGSGVGAGYGPTYTTGDTIGCLWDLTDSSVTFTKNGKSLGVAFRGVSGELFPTVGMRTEGEVAVANFGASDQAWLERTASAAAVSESAPELAALPFDPAVPGSRRYLFDIEAYVAGRRAAALAAAAATELPRPLEAVSGVVLQYLVHIGAPRAAAAFAAATDRGPLLASEMAALAEREAAYTAVVEGRIDDAVAGVSARHPALLPSSPRLAVRLLCVKFVELVRAGRLDEALAFAQTELAPYRDGAGPPGGGALGAAGGGGASGAAAGGALAAAAAAAAVAPPSTAAFIPLASSAGAATATAVPSAGLADVLLGAGRLGGAAAAPPPSAAAGPASDRDAAAASASVAAAVAAVLPPPPAAWGAHSSALAMHAPPRVAAFDTGAPAPLYRLAQVQVSAASAAAAAAAAAREAPARAAAAAATAAAVVDAASAAAAAADADAAIASATAAADARADLEAALSLLAYDDPSAGPAAAVMDAARRRTVARDLRDALLTAQARSSASSLERLAAHAQVMLGVQATDVVGALSLVGGSDFVPPVGGGASASRRARSRGGDRKGHGRGPTV